MPSLALSAPAVFPNPSEPSACPRQTARTDGARRAPKGRAPRDPFREAKAAQPRAGAGDTDGVREQPPVTVTAALAVGDVATLPDHGAERAAVQEQPAPNARIRRRKNRGNPRFAGENTPARSLREDQRKPATHVPACGFGGRPGATRRGSCPGPAVQSVRIAAPGAPMNYDCSDCPSYCCAYPIIPVTVSDIRRFAKALGLTYQEARERHTEPEGKNRRKIRQRPDAQFGASACTFLDRRTRLCTIYEARPEVCSSHPGDDCEWHDRRLLETMIKGRPVIRLRVAPWTIDASHIDYTAERRPLLLKAYAKGDGIIPE